jgi:hypothetical protein
MDIKIFDGRLEEAWMLGFGCRMMTPCLLSGCHLSSVVFEASILAMAAMENPLESRMEWDYPQDKKS